MHKKNLVKIINQELEILSGLIDGFKENEEVHPLEVDMALSKTKDVATKLELLKQQIGPNIEQVTAKPTPEPIVPEPEIKKDLAIEKEKNEVVEVETTPEKIAAPIPEPEPISVPLKEEPAKIEIEASQDSKLETLVETESEEIVKPAFDDIQEDLISPELNSEKEDLPAPTPKLEKPEVVIEPSPKAKLEIEDQSIIADKFTDQGVSLNETLASIKSNKDLASTLEDRPITDLKKSIKLNDKIWFINELFEQDNQLYNETVEAINQSNNLDEALALLFQKFNWDQEKKSTISFLELVFRRFANQQ